LALAAVALVSAVALAACGDDGDRPPPDTPLADALATIGGGGANGSLGVGWAEPDLVEDAGGGTELIDAALGPNADTYVKAAPELRRRFGIDPLAADRLVSVGGSYAFGIRIDGVDGAPLGLAIARSGARERAQGDLFLTDGTYAVAPDPLIDAGLKLGAYGAFGPDEAILTISRTSRAALLGRGDRLTEEPIYRAAADCLGDVAAVRMVPDRLLLSTELGVDLVAVGAGEGRDVLCLLGGDAARANEIAAALERSLDPAARDPVTGEPLIGSIRTTDVSRSSYDGVEVVRAALTPSAGEPPGFLFGTISRGSLVRMVGG
jgi:hypothetical protein